MKNTITALIVLFLMLPSLAYGSGDLGMDRESHYKEARITACFTIYMENNYFYSEVEEPMHEIMCKDTFDLLTKLIISRDERQNFTIYY